jgi:hypothetical protein
MIRLRNGQTFRLPDYDGWDDVEPIDNDPYYEDEYRDDDFDVRDDYEAYLEQQRWEAEHDEELYNNPDARYHEDDPR